MQKRLAALADANKSPITASFKLITPDLQRGAMPDLATPKGQVMLETNLVGIELIIVDNISTLCRNTRENEADSWLPVQEWALRMRASGKSVLFIHHAGKGGNQRGTSKREDILDTVIALKRPDDYKPKEGAVFQVYLKKLVDFLVRQQNHLRRGLLPDQMVCKNGLRSPYKIHLMIKLFIWLIKG